MLAAIAGMAIALWRGFATAAFGCGLLAPALWCGLLAVPPAHVADIAAGTTSKVVLRTVEGRFLRAEADGTVRPHTFLPGIGLTRPVVNSMSSSLSVFRRHDR